MPVCSVCYFAVSSCWATVCTMVRPMLSDRCPVCLSVLSVTLVYCCQTVGWIKMKFGLQVGLGPGHIVLDGDPASPPLKGGRAPQFSTHICCGQTARWMKMPLGMEVGLSPGHIVLDGDLAAPPRQGHSSSPTFRPMSVVARVAHPSYC